MKAKIVGGSVALAGLALIALAIWIQAYMLSGHRIFSYYFGHLSSAITSILFTTSLKFFVPAFYKESTLMRFGLLLVVALGCVTFGAMPAILLSILALLGWIFLEYGIRQAVHGIPMRRSSAPEPKTPNKAPEPTPVSVTPRAVERKSK